MRTHGRAESAFRHEVAPRIVDFGSFVIRRSLPTRATRAVGPWVFFDHFGPHAFPAGGGADVIPHPHVNLATVTYLFDGEIEHRDSIGTVQVIRPGAINLMMAGRGIVHSERSPAALRRGEHSLHGLQLWHALPVDHEEAAPSFNHYAADEIPEVDFTDARVRVMIGAAYGRTSPVITVSPTLYVEIRLRAGAGIELPPGVDETALYLVDGDASLDGEEVEALRFYVARRPEGTLSSRAGAHLVLIGGEPLGKRFIFWNFVSSSRERIEAAKADWQANAIGIVPGDEDERAPLPDHDDHARMK